MTPDLKAMKEAAEKATPGEWRAESRYVWDGPVKGDRELIAEAESVEYAAHIAASSPKNVLDTIALLEEARETLSFYRDEWRACRSGPPDDPKEWWNPTDELSQDRGRRARATLARIDAAMGAGGEG